MSNDGFICARSLGWQVSINGDLAICTCLHKNGKQGQATPIKASSLAYDLNRRVLLVQNGAHTFSY